MGFINRINAVKPFLFGCCVWNTLPNVLSYRLPISKYFYLQLLYSPLISEAVSTKSP